MKKVLSVLLTLAMVLALMPMSGISVSAATEGDYEYSVCEGGATITDVNESIRGDVIVPSNLGGFPVVSLGYRSFENCDYITSVVVPDTVLYLEHEVFSCCDLLTTVTLSENIKVLSYGLFNFCENLKTFTIPEGVTEIESEVFRGCSSLLSIEIPDKVTRIGSYAFSFCESITSLDFSKNIEYIGDCAFVYCDKLTEINVSNENAYYCSVDGVLFDKGKTTLIRFPQRKNVTTYEIPTGVISISDFAFAECEFLTSVTIPNSVKTIGNQVFEFCKPLLSIEIPDSVTSIGRNAFCGCNSLHTVSIGDGITSLGENMFLWCDNLTSISVSENLNAIGQQALNGCRSLTSFNIPKNVTSIADDAFDYCDNLTSFVVEEGNQVFSSLDGVLFNKDKTTLIRFPEGKSGEYSIPDFVTTINESAFESSKITAVIIPESINQIPDGAFYCCYFLTSVDIPNTVTDIGKAAFGFCGFKSISLPEGILYLDDSAFYHCNEMEYIYFPKSVISVGENAFYYCYSLKDVWYFGSKIDKSATTIENVQNECFINAKWHYNTCQGEHVFTSDCDKLCNFCDWERATTVKHTYSSVCDSDCDVCATVRDVTHAYSNSCDAECDECGEGRTAPHTFSADCDIQCNVCDYTRVTATEHTYASDCDDNCNLCGAVRTAKHSYSKATCTNPATCKVCKATTGKANGHSYKTTTTKATLTKNGSTVKNCTVCGNVASNTAIKYVKTFKLSATSYTYDGKVKAPTVTVKDSAGKILKKNTDYTVTYASGRKNAGTYKVTIKMIGKYSGTKTLSFKINPAKLSSYKLSATTYTYDGKVKKPTVTVKNSSGTKLTTSSYTVTYSSGRKNVGTYKVTIKGKGNYTGTKTLTFKINPAKTTAYKLTAGKKNIKVAITKKSTQVTGYQIQYSTSKTFSKATIKTISSYKTTKYTLKSLSAKKTYYVRVRTYKTIGKTKYYSGWSTYKYVKTK